MAPIEMENAPDDSSTGAFSVLNQKVELDFTFCPRSVKGKTTIDIQPQTAQLREISLNCRQLKPSRVKVENRLTSFNYSNLYQRLTLYPGTGIQQHHWPKQRLQKHKDGVEDELVIFVPETVKILEVQPEDAGMDAPSKGNVFYAPLKVEIEYVLDDFRDAFHFVGVEDGDSRYPHAYTRNSPFPGMASCLFPCVDDGSTRCIYEISIRYPRTLGDALSKPPSRPGHPTSHVQANGIPKADSVMSDADDDHTDLTEEEKAMEMVVICSGELTDDILDPEDPSRKTASFTCATPVLPQHIGFVIGPFEHVDLSDFRDTSDDDRLGDNAIKVHAFCLPGREDEVRNSAMMLARTLDNFTERYQSYAFEKAYKLAFVDDLDCDASHTASFSICSSRLLFPETVWEPLEHTTRVLVHAVASQWIGVDVIAQGPNDHWVIVGGSWFMTELYLRELFGRNDHRFRQKLMVDKIVQMDVRRPSLHSLGAYLPLDPGELEFMELKALLVLSILHNRLVKQSGKNGVDRCLYRLLFHARNGKLPNGAISTDSFLEICEKVGHQKLDTFFNQWIMSSGCPTFECSPTFNKKKQVVQLIIKQTQSDATLRSIENSFASKDFMREAKERIHGFSPATDWPAFVGPMTIRIHEADGTPYEHIVDINSSAVKVEIPYNTKYKRLKRNRLNKERMAAAHGIDAAGESQEDVTFYSLGDMFLSVEEAEEWKISEWSPEDETKMDNEAYEWIRVDADFEWICRANLVDMPSYMYVSQLQQDKDVVAQAESIQYLALKEGHPLISSILVKTLMDHRYFHGIRTMAAEVMAQSAKKQISWIGLFHLKKAFRELFCLPGQPMTRSNDFSDRASYLIQCAIPKAIARIKDIDGKAPMEAKRFLLDIMRYNDNRGNAYSDDHYIATLMRSLAESLTSSKTGSMDITLNLEDEAEEFDFTKKALEELSRHQRLDEWIPTYQNIYTITALDCLFQLSTNRVIPFKPSEFMQYAQIGNADNVRIKAWDCLIRLGMARRDSVLKFLIHEIQSDPSPYVRGQLLRIFDTAVGQIATGDVFAIDSAKKTQADSLVIEHSAGTSEREASLARQKLDGALAGLKADLANHHALRLALEDALMSTTLSARDMSELLDFSSMVFDTDDSLQIRLKYPRYWRVERVGRTQLRFYESDRVRTQPVRPLKPVEPIPQPALIERSVAPPAPKVKLQLKTAKPPKLVASPTQQPESAMSLEKRQSKVLSPPAERATSPATIAVKLPPKAPSLPPVIKKESPAAPPKSSPPAAILPPKKTPTPTPTPAIQSPVSAPSVAPARASAPPVPAAIPIPTSVSTPPAIHSPIPAPAPKLKIKTGISKSSSSTPKAAGTPVSKPATKPATPKPASSKPPVAKSSVPKQPKPKKSKIVKLKLPPTVLSQFPKESGRKRKLESEDTERPSKRQSLDPNGLLNGGKSRVSLERHGGEKPRLLLKLNVGRDNLPPS